MQEHLCLMQPWVDGVQELCNKTQEQYEWGLAAVVRRHICLIVCCSVYALQQNSVAF